jgi:hypothetical protein
MPSVRNAAAAGLATLLGAQHVQTVQATKTVENMGKATGSWFPGISSVLPWGGAAATNTVVPQAIVQQIEIPHNAIFSRGEGTGTEQQEANMAARFWNQNNGLYTPTQAQKAGFVRSNDGIKTIHNAASFPARDQATADTKNKWRGLLEVTTENSKNKRDLFAAIFGSGHEEVVPPVPNDNIQRTPSADFARQDAVEAVRVMINDTERASGNLEESSIVSLLQEAEAAIRGSDITFPFANKLSQAEVGQALNAVLVQSGVDDALKILELFKTGDYKGDILLGKQQAITAGLVKKLQDATRANGAPFQHHGSGVAAIDTFMFYAASYSHLQPQITSASLTSLKLSITQFLKIEVPGLAHYVPPKLEPNAAALFEQLKFTKERAITDHTPGDKETLKRALTAAADELGPSGFWPGVILQGEADVIHNIVANVLNADTTEHSRIVTSSTEITSEDVNLLTNFVDRDWVNATVGPMFASIYDGLDAKNMANLVGNLAVTISRVTSLDSAAAAKEAIHGYNRFPTNQDGHPVIIAAMMGLLLGAVIKEAYYRGGTKTTMASNALLDIGKALGILYASQTGLWHFAPRSIGISLTLMIHYVTAAWWGAQILPEPVRQVLPKMWTGLTQLANRYTVSDDTVNTAYQSDSADSGPVVAPTGGWGHKLDTFVAPDTRERDKKLAEEAYVRTSTLRDGFKSRRM